MRCYFQVGFVPSKTNDSAFKASLSDSSFMCGNYKMMEDLLHERTVLALMLYTKLPMSAVNFDDGVNGGSIRKI